MVVLGIPTTTVAAIRFCDWYVSKIRFRTRQVVLEVGWPSNGSLLVFPNPPFYSRSSFDNYSSVFMVVE